MEAWNGSWNRCPGNPAVLSAVAALVGGIGAGSAGEAEEHASRNASPPSESKAVAELRPFSGQGGGTPRRAVDDGFEAGGGDVKAVRGIQGQAEGLGDFARQFPVGADRD